MEFVTSAFSYMYTLCPFSFLLFPFFIMRKVEQQMNEAIPVSYTHLTLPTTTPV